MYRPFGMENAQQRSNRRSLALHVAIIRRLREDPELWKIPLRNLDRWKVQDGEEPMYQLWRHILTTNTHQEISQLLVSRSEQAIHLRSSSPFIGIIDQDERNRIFERYEALYQRWRAK